MTDREALRVAFACAIDAARHLPKDSSTRERVETAVKTLADVVKGERWFRVQE